ncbi:MAG TPA: cupredoxin domain-containing protein [bacterium]|nr:cupredoxin domain-containing protein [bacterium]
MMRYQIAAAVLLGILAAYAPSAMPASYSSPAAPASPGVSTPAAKPAIRTIAITLAEFRFTPSAITVKVGQPIILRLTNKGTMEHEFVSPTFFAAARGVAVSGGELEDGEEIHVARGKTVTIRLTPTRTGPFRFWCGEKLKGKLHRDLGMRGVLTVTR